MIHRIKYEIYRFRTEIKIQNQFSKYVKFSELYVMRIEDMNCMHTLMMLLNLSDLTNVETLNNISISFSQYQ